MKDRHLKIENLAKTQTPHGDLTLCRRSELLLQNQEIYELMLGDGSIVSSLSSESGEELARLGLMGLTGKLDVIVGGLGLGSTAASVLQNTNVSSLLVIDLFEELIGWHQAGLIPLGVILFSDKRCELRQGDFVELARTGFDVANKTRRYDAVLVDIDHSSKHYLDEKNRSFYSLESLGLLRNQLKDGGVFALISKYPADVEFTKHLESVFTLVRAHNTKIYNPNTNSTLVNSVYVFHKRLRLN